MSICTSELIAASGFPTLLASLPSVMITVDVDLGDRAYPIHIGSGLISQAALFAPHIRGARAVIVKA